jgi:hypothetical protein
MRRLKMQPKARIHHIPSGNGPCLRGNQRSGICRAVVTKFDGDQARAHLSLTTDSHQIVPPIHPDVHHCPVRWSEVLGVHWSDKADLGGRDGVPARSGSRL